MNDEDKKSLLDCFVNAGAALLRCGAEIYRVEESVQRMAKGFGASDVAVFAIPSLIIVTLRFCPEDVPMTSTRRVPVAVVDMGMASDVNALCRKASTGTMTVAQFEEELAVITARPVWSKKYIPYLHPLAAAAFCLFFGGNLFDAAVALLCGAVIFFVTDFFARYGANSFFSCVAAAAACSTVAVLFSLTGWSDGTEATIIGSLMLLVPGVALTNFMRNLIAGDVLSGLVKLAESLLTACGIALGAGIPVALFSLLGGGL